MPEPVARTAAAVHLRDDVAALVVEASPELGATLVRYTARGEPAGELWYGSAEEAQRCAARDYGSTLGPWLDVPATEPDPVAFVLGR